jgi:hypothetical protein
MKPTPDFWTFYGRIDGVLAFVIWFFVFAFIAANPLLWLSSTW